MKKITIHIDSYNRDDGTNVSGYDKDINVRELNPDEELEKSRIKENLLNENKSTLGETGDDEDIYTDEEIEENLKSMRGSKSDTLEFYEGDEKRELLHQEIEKDVFSGTATKNKIFYMTGGAPANGKSTYLESEFSEIPENIIEIDSDFIKSKLPDYNKLIETKSWKSAAATVHEESSALSKEFLAKSLDEDYDTLLDGVGDGGYDSFKKKVEGYKSNGHKVVANYTTLDTELSVKIAKSRAEKTKRYVPIAYVRAMNRDVPRMVPRAINDGLYDKFTLWDTNIQGTPRQVIKFENGKVVSVNKKLWIKFLQKGGSRNVSRYSDLFD